MVVVGRMDPIIPPYFATEIQGRERAISCKREPSTSGNQSMVFLTVWGDSSLVIDKLCDEAVEEDTAVVCFYFDFAARSEQSPVNMLGSLLRQLVTGLEGIPEAVVRSFRNQKKVIGGRGLQVSGILKMFQTIATTKRTFICVDALDECAPENRMVILEITRTDRAGVARYSHIADRKIAYPESGGKEIGWSGSFSTDRAYG